MRTITLIQLGLGNIGRELVRETLAVRSTFAAELGVRLEFGVVADSAAALSAPAGLSEEALRQAVAIKALHGSLDTLEGARPHGDPGELVGDMTAGGVQAAVLIDVTASEDSPPAILAALGAGYAVVLANKLPLCVPHRGYRHLMDAAGRDRLRREATVGAGLPIFRTLESIQHTGDAVTRIRGNLSGSVASILSAVQTGQKFSAAVAAAQAAGYTEPDPREDLFGRDAARKALILARAIGRSVEPAHVELHPVIPTGGIAELSLADLPAALARFDDDFTIRARAAAAAGRALRYVVEVSRDACRVGLEAVERTDPLYSLTGTNNLVAFYTRRYHDQPLILAGPGAGPVVTVSAILADLEALALRNYGRVR